MFACLLIFSLFACGGKSDLEKFLAENGDTMESELSLLFGVNSEVSSKVENNAFVFEVKAYEFDNLIDIQKSALKERLREIIPTEDMIEQGRENDKMLRDLENYIIIVRNSKDELIVEVRSIEDEPATEVSTRETLATVEPVSAQVPE